MTPAASLALPLIGPRVRVVRAEDAHALAIVRQSDNEVVGRISLVQSSDTLTVDELCIEEPLRGYGCGSDAGRLLLHAAETARYRRLRAWAPPDSGLAVYFWFRMGLRPLQGEGPNGGIWLERGLGKASPLHPLQQLG